MDNDQEKQMKEEEEKKRQKMTRIARMKCMLKIKFKLYFRFRGTRNPRQKSLHFFWKISNG